MNITIIKSYEKVWNIYFLLIITLPVLFIYKYIHNFRVNQAAIINLLTLILFAFYILSIIKEGKLNYQANSLNLPILLFILIAIFSILLNGTFLVSLKDFINLLSYCFVYFFVINKIKNKNSFYFTIKIFCITTLLVSLYLMIQYYGIDPFLPDINRLTSTLGNKNYVASYLGLIFPVTFSFFLTESNIRKKVFYTMVLLINSIAIVICHTRAIWIALFLSLIFFGYLLSYFKMTKVLKDNKKWLIILFSFFLLIALVYLIDIEVSRKSINILNGLTSIVYDYRSSHTVRLLIWQSTIGMIKDKPLFGLGLGTFKLHYLNYQANFLQQNPGYIDFMVKAAETHNEYLQIWAEMGIMGILAFLFIIAIFYKTKLNLINKIKNIKGKIIVIGLISAVTVTLIHSMFSFPFHIPVVGSAFWFIIGLAIASENIFCEESKKDRINEGKKIPFYFAKNASYYKWLRLSITILIIIFTLLVINILVIKPYRAELYLYQGNRYLTDEDYQSALPILSYAEQLDSSNGRALYALGVTYHSLNKYNLAIYYLQKSKKYMMDINTFYVLGLSYFKLNMLNKAKEEFEYAVYLNPEFINGYHYLGLLYFRQEDYDKAIKNWKKTLEVKPHFSSKYIILYNLGLAYKKKEMPDQALEYFNQALPLVPEDSPILDNIKKEIDKIYKFYSNK